MFKVMFNMAGFAFEEFFNDYQEAKNFAEDQQLVGFQTWILEVK